MDINLKSLDRAIGMAVKNSATASRLIKEALNRPVRIQISESATKEEVLVSLEAVLITLKLDAEWDRICGRALGAGSERDPRD